jgi:hypothetical protein
MYEKLVSYICQVKKTHKTYHGLDLAGQKIWPANLSNSAHHVNAVNLLEIVILGFLWRCPGQHSVDSAMTAVWSFLAVGQELLGPLILFEINGWECSANNDIAVQHIPNLRSPYWPASRIHKNSSGIWCQLYEDPAPM